MFKMFKAAAAAVMMLALSPAMADTAKGFDPQNLFFGAGISSNSVSHSDDGTGYQIFAGYEFGEVAKNVKVDVEVGYMNTGDMDIRNCVSVFGTTFCSGSSTHATGLWSTGVARLAVNPQFELLARAGFDFGDDDGFMFGVGGGYHIDKRSTLRLEYVERDSVNSVQFNFVYHP